MTNYQVISGHSITVQRQGYELNRTVRVEISPHDLDEDPNTRKVRVFIHKDTSYDFQSQLNTKVWDGSQWHQVLSWDGNSPLAKTMPYTSTTGRGDISPGAENATEAAFELMLAETVVVLA